LFWITHIKKDDVDDYDDDGDGDNCDHSLVTVLP
jgi:hypothetical protein